jgi:phytoene synthase
MSAAQPVPQSPEITAAYAACRAIAKREAKNFYYSFRVLPQHKSDAMCAVYAFMRKADDLADDESLSLDARREAMAAWTAAWRASRTASTTDPIFLALNHTQQRFAIPDELLEQLVAGTTLDLQPVQPGVGHTHIDIIALDGTTTSFDFDVYDTFDYLYQYCYLVASVVGLVCIKIFGYTDPRAEQLAERTGIAFQLTNILRDVKEDAERGRIYLPSDDAQAAGTDVDAIRKACDGAPVDPATLSLLQLEIDRAQDYYRSASELLPLLDADARPSMRVLVLIYHRLLDRIAANPSAVFTQRVSVPTAQKLGILSVGILQSFKARLLV